MGRWYDAAVSSPTQAGVPCLAGPEAAKTWVAGPSPAMTRCLRRCTSASDVDRKRSRHQTVGDAAAEATSRMSARQTIPHRQPGRPGWPLQPQHRFGLAHHIGQRALGERRHQPGGAHQLLERRRTAASTQLHIRLAAPPDNPGGSAPRTASRSIAPACSRYSRTARYRCAASPASGRPWSETPDRRSRSTACRSAPAAATSHAAPRAWRRGWRRPRAGNDRRRRRKAGTPGRRSGASGGTAPPPPPPPVRRSADRSGTPAPWSGSRPPPSSATDSRRRAARGFASSGRRAPSHA